MEDYIQAVFAAWDVVKEKLVRDPGELAVRLARRRRAAVQRPPRAWCLGVRASDRRINPATAAIVPEWAYPRQDLEGRMAGERLEHEVTLDSRLLRRVCRAVETSRFGMRADELARELGCNYASLWKGMSNGALTVRHVPGIQGRPTPLVSCKWPLDPSSASSWQSADPVWGTTWRYLADHVPEGIEQVVRRVPHCRPEPDGGEKFWGWRWVCPGCGKTARTLFYPMPPLLRPRLDLRSLRPALREELDGVEHAGCFACQACHRLKYFTRMEANAWNELVTRLSGGLMYGSEVERPSWFKGQARPKRRPSTRPRRAPSRRREEVKRLLVGTTLTWGEIGKELGIGYGTVCKHVKLLYRRHAVHKRRELREKLAEEGAARHTG